MLHSGINWLFLLSLIVWRVIQVVVFIISFVLFITELYSMV